MRFRHVVGASALALAAVSCSLNVDPSAAGTINLFIDLSDTQLTVGQESITFGVTARNVGDSPLTLTGPGNCLLYVEVRNTLGTLVWDSNGTCQGATVSEQLAVGGEKLQSFTWDGSSLAGAPLGPGLYVVRAVARLSTGAYYSPSQTIALD